MIECVDDYNLKYCGDSVEWCPANGFQHILVCGSYQLVPDSGQRVGLINLFSYADSKLELLQEIELEAGLLDAKWEPKNQTGIVLIAVALSNGNLSIYKLDCNQLVLVGSILVCHSGMALAVDWSTGVVQESNPKLVVSQSDGSITVVELIEGCLSIISNFKAHDYEAWIAAFNYWNTNIIYTGGDDNKLKMYDLRANPQKSIHTDTSHNVGITSIQCNQKYEGYLASGSYEDVRIWKTSSTLLECLDREEMTGGSWRVKWNQRDNCKKLAVAAMHNGFQILDFSLLPNIDTDLVETKENTSVNKEKAEVSASYLNSKTIVKNKYDYKGPHSSLGYGIDWCFEDKNIIAACSFYDKKLSIGYLKI